MKSPNKKTNCVSTLIKSPIGTILIEASESGVTRVEMNNSARGKIESTDHPILSDAARQLNEYFRRERKVFDLPVDLLCASEFAVKVLNAVARIPFGKTTTYGEIARKVGAPKAARAVGGAVGANPVPIIIPCHRVVAANGKLGGFTGGIDLKKKLLEIEGIKF
jgi:methylated-DNA-[protein]-cysteine S-methyltransferase